MNISDFAFAMREASQMKAAYIAFSQIEEEENSEFDIEPFYAVESFDEVAEGDWVIYEITDNNNPVWVMPAFTDKAVVEARLIELFKGEFYTFEQNINEGLQATISSIDNDVLKDRYHALFPHDVYSRYKHKTDLMGLMKTRLGDNEQAREDFIKKMTKKNSMNV